MSAAIASIVEQILGGQRIPKSARPRRADKPLPQVVRKPANARDDTLDKLEAALRQRYDSVRDISIRAGVRYHTALHLLPILERHKRAVGRKVAWRVGVRREYRRAR